MSSSDRAGPAGAGRGGNPKVPGGGGASVCSNGGGSVQSGNSGPNRNRRGQGRGGGGGGGIGRVRKHKVNADDGAPPRAAPSQPQPQPQQQQPKASEPGQKDNAKKKKNKRSNRNNNKSKAESKEGEERAIPSQFGPGKGPRAIQLPLLKIELRRISSNHLKKYEIMLAQKQKDQDQLNPQPKQVTQAFTENSTTNQAVEINQAVAEINHSKEEKLEETINPVDNHMSQEDNSQRFLTKEYKQARRLAFRNVKAMLMLLQDALSATPTAASNILPAPVFPSSDISKPQSKSSVAWLPSNIQLVLDQNSLHNMLLEWAYPPAELSALWNSILASDNQVDNTNLNQEHSPSKPALVTVCAKVLYVTPPRKSRRRGEVSGMISVVLTPTLESVTNECQRQLDLANKQVEPPTKESPKDANEFPPNEKLAQVIHLDSNEPSDVPSVLTKVSDNLVDPANPVSSSTIGTTVATSEQASQAPQAPVLDKAKMLAISHLILDGAFDKIRAHSVQIGLAPYVQIRHSPHSKTFPEPRYSPTDTNTTAGKKGGRRPRGGDSSRYENTLDKTQDYQSFLQLYEEKKGSVQFVVLDQSHPAVPTQPSDKKTSETPSVNSAQVAAIVVHLQEKRREQEAKKRATKQRKTVVTSDTKPKPTAALAKSKRPTPKPKLSSNGDNRSRAGGAGRVTGAKASGNNGKKKPNETKSTTHMQGINGAPMLLKKASNAENPAPNNGSGAGKSQGLTKT